MSAVSLPHPSGFSDMKARPVTKKLKDKSFAADVPREGSHRGTTLINRNLNDHIAFLVGVYAGRNDF